MSYPTPSGVPADMVLVSANGVCSGILLLMIWTRRGACHTGVALPKAEPMGVTIGTNRKAARIDLGESFPRVETPPDMGGRNSVKFVA